MATNEQGLPRAMVREVNGEPVMDDPDALSVFKEADKEKCRRTLQRNSDRVEHFKQRISALGLTATDAVIVILNVDDLNGNHMASALMPGHNWQEVRDRGEIPIARGIAMREGIQEALLIFDKEAAKKLQEMTAVAVVVVDHGVAEVFPA